MSANATTALTVGGERSSGEAVRKQNVMATVAIANILKTSLGPMGLDKMLVDDVGDVTISNDGATIVKLLDVEHPAAKILVELAQLQDDEVGDGTTSVVLIAAELIKLADELIIQKLHPTTIINGYRMACKEACDFMKRFMQLDIEQLGKESIVSAARTSMSSKLTNMDSDYFANMAVDAANLVKVSDGKGGFTYPTKAINILKAHGRSMQESVLINGYALNCTVAGQQMPKSIKNAKIACLDFNLQKVRLKLGVQVLVNDPEKLEEIRNRESDITKERIKKIIDAGANVILTTGGIDDLCMKYFVEASVMAVRRCKKSDLKRIARMSGGHLVASLSNMEGDETFEATNLGEADSVTQERICDDELIIIRGTKARSACSLILRGPNDFYVDEMERSIHDALQVVKRVCESRSVVPGGGACEAALNAYLENMAFMMGSREQLPVAEFARALLVIPKQLAVNAALDSTDLVAKLCAYHHAAIKKYSGAASGGDVKDDMRFFGLDLNANALADCRKIGVFEPMISKVKSLRFATEAAITILRIDDMIKLYEEPKPHHGGY
ncbi:Alpha subunit of chaperonin-containing T-complex [Cichlidogyrus casuarinus]|uniref:T-complex protein 1 subunit alpha n=1 Tax=Cichlidogyrus casuarinus TaxID=1844966 RepID=A0ABD2QEC4_9PLAT